MVLMQRIDGILGNVDNDAELSRRVADHEENGSLERVVIPAKNRHRSRLRVETDAGTDLGIIVDDPPLCAGDVLVLDDDRAVVVAFEDEEAVVIDLPDASKEGVKTAIELGHRIGNQHWDLAVCTDAAYIPVAADRHIIESVLTESLPSGVEPRYEMVDASLWIDSTSGNDRTEDGHGTDHSHEGGHVHGDDHSHAQDDHAHKQPYQSPDDGQADNPTSSPNYSHGSDEA